MVDFIILNLYHIKKILQGLNLSSEAFFNEGGKPCRIHFDGLDYIYETHPVTLSHGVSFKVG